MKIFSLLTAFSLTIGSAHAEGNQDIIDNAGEICRTALDQELGKTFSIIKSNSTTVVLEEYKGRSFLCEYTGSGLTLFNTTNDDRDFLASYKIDMTKKEIVLESEDHSVAIPRKSSKRNFDIDGKQRLIELGKALLMLIIFLPISFGLWFSFITKTREYTKISKTKKNLIRLVFFSLVLYCSYSLVFVRSTDQPTLKRTGVMSADQARRKCLNAYDYRNMPDLDTLVVSPWSGSADKAFRVAFRYEKARGGFGCTVFKDGQIEVNYNP